MDAWFISGDLQRAVSGSVWASRFQPVILLLGHLPFWQNSVFYKVSPPLNMYLRPFPSWARPSCHMWEPINRRAHTQLRLSPSFFHRAVNSAAPSNAINKVHRLDLDNHHQTRGNEAHSFVCSKVTYAHYYGSFTTAPSASVRVSYRCLMGALFICNYPGNVQNDVDIIVPRTCRVPNAELLAPHHLTLFRAYHGNEDHLRTSTLHLQLLWKRMASSIHNLSTVDAFIDGVLEKDKY